ncbi:MAG: hypothetical protein P8X74_02735 [Reinekea sp.]
MTFLSDQKTYLSNLGVFKDFLPYQASCYNPYPFVLSHQLANELMSMASVLIKGVTAIVEHYLCDQQMQRLMPLPAHLLTYLHLAQGVPYRSGSMRPDLLFGESGIVKLCEINARFPLNGMTMSQWLADAAAKSSYFNERAYHPAASLNQIQSQILARFERNKPLVRVATSEKGGESQYFLSLFAQSGAGTINVHPGELCYQDGAIRYQGRAVEQFLLEIDREDLCLFKSAVIEAIITQSNYINDVRTLILVHDKRILSLLANAELMSRYLTEKEWAGLNRFLPQSLDLTDDNVFRQILDSQNQWVIKKSSGGRGVDLYIGQQCSAEFWQRTLREKRYSYMAQSFVPPGKFPISLLQNGVFKTQFMHVVGAMPCFDSVCYGPGMFRASQELCVNVGDGSGHTIFLTSAIADKPFRHCASACQVTRRGEHALFDPD